MTVKDCITEIINNDYANIYLYSDDRYNWNIKYLLKEMDEDDMGKEAMLNDNWDIVLLDEDGVADGHYVTRVNKLNDEAEAEFLNGFCDAMPNEYDMEKDLETDMPWCAPWTDGSDNHIIIGQHPYTMGKWHAKGVRDEWKKLYEEQEALGD